MRARALFALAPLVFGLVVAATSSAAGPPQIGESWATEVTATAANLRAAINPEGASSTYRFEYLTQGAYEANLAGARDGFTGAALAPPSGAAPLGGGSTATAVVQHAGSLLSSTAYRYRARATNAAGTEFGPEHIFTTSEPTGANPPIDARGYELVSPVEKDGGAVGAPEAIFGGGDFQTAGDGASFTFSSPSSFGEAAGAPPVSQYVSTRSGTGWSTRNVSAPLESGGYGDEPDGAPFRVFSADLARALMLNGARCPVGGTCPPSYSLWEGGPLASLPTLPDLRAEGVTADLGHVVLRAPGGLYEWGGGALETVTEVPGATLAAPIGAISEDGRRVYWDDPEDGSIRLHESGAATRLLPRTSAAGVTFQASSADGRLAFFTREGGLYRYDVSADESNLIATGVVGVLAVSTGGADVYLQDAAGLEHWHEGTITTVVEGAAIAAPSDYPPATATARVSADGEHLAFLSTAEIPPFDNHDANTGTPDTELYLYGPPPGGGAPRLVCASCNPTGERPQGSAQVPGAVANGSNTLYRPRVLSAGGNRVFFETSDALVIGDTNARPDVYEWEDAGVGACTRGSGCLGLISGAHGEGGRFLDASADGDDVFFLTGDSLVGADPGSIDVYDDRVGGGFAEPQPPFVCTGDACQPLPSPPEDPGPGTLVPTSGNPPLKIEGPRRKKHRHGRRHHHNHKGRHHHGGSR